MPWQLDPAHSSLAFSAKHMLVSTVKGQFTSWKVDAQVNEDDLTKSSAVVSVDAASLDSGAEMRDDHLRSPDFFDVEHHPTITFAIRRVEPRGGSQYRFAGDLTIRGVTREIALDGEIAGPIEDPWGGRRIAISAEGKINRKDWGLNWNVALEAGGLLVSDQIKISIDAELQQAA